MSTKKLTPVQCGTQKANIRNLKAIRTAATGSAPGYPHVHAGGAAGISAGLDEAIARAIGRCAMNAKSVEEMKAALPLITPQHVEQFEANWTADVDGVVRRSALALLSRPGATIIEGAVSDRKTALAIAMSAEAIDAYVHKLKGLQEWLEIARFRCRVALASRPDAEHICAEAAAQWRCAS